MKEPMQPMERHKSQKRAADMRLIARERNSERGMSAGANCRNQSSFEENPYLNVDPEFGETRHEFARRSILQNEDGSDLTTEQFILMKRNYEK